MIGHPRWCMVMQLLCLAAMQASPDVSFALLAGNRTPELPARRRERPRSKRDSLQPYHDCVPRSGGALYDPSEFPFHRLPVEDTTT